MKAVLDTNFIISCMKRGIDFLDILKQQGFNVFLPKEVFQELKDLRLKVSHDDRMAIDLAFDLFEKRKIKKITLGKNSPDRSLIALGKRGAYIASLDNAVKREVPNKILISNSKNDLVIERS